MDWPDSTFRAGGGGGGVGGGPPSLRGFPLNLKCNISWGKIKIRSKWQKCQHLERWIYWCFLFFICNFPEVFCFKSVKKDTELFTGEMTCLEFVQQRKWGAGWEQGKHIVPSEFSQQLTQGHS